jgi:hypothetical protein
MRLVETVTWKWFDWQVTKSLMFSYPGAKLSRDVTLPGASSDIAILVEYRMGDETLRVVVEHRRYGGMIGLKQDEMFLD